MKKCFAYVWMVEGKLFHWEIHWDMGKNKQEFPGKCFEKDFDCWVKAKEWIKDFERCDYIWTIPASRGACNALLVHNKLINNVILKNAEKAALDRALMNASFEPAVIRDDVINSIREFSDVEVEEVL